MVTLGTEVFHWVALLYDKAKELSLFQHYFQIIRLDLKEEIRKFKGAMSRAKGYCVNKLFISVF